MQKVTENVYAETGCQGCNPGFVITSDGIVMIDTPQLPGDALKYRAELEKLGQPKYLINTEPHGDHYAGNYFFDVTVIAHEGTRQRIADTDVAQLKERLKQTPGAPNLDDYTVRVPSISFTGSMKLFVGDHEFELLHLPGHTASETAVFIPRERVIFTGDNIFYQEQTFFQEALPREWLESLESLKKLDADTLIPGHGEVCSKDYIDEQAGVVRAWIAAVKEAVAKGWSLEEAKERIPFLDPYPMKGDREAFGRELHKTNVTRLYALAKENRL